jgi:hypothetical protein
MRHELLQLYLQRLQSQTFIICEPHLLDLHMCVRSNNWIQQVLHRFNALTFPFHLCIVLSPSLRTLSAIKPQVTVSFGGALSFEA